MTKINWREVSFAEGVAAIDGNKLTEKPKKFNCPPGVNKDYYDNIDNIEFFENGIALAAFSNWRHDWYQEICAETPQFFLGILSNDS